jgi:hypothetical protein
MDGAPPAPEANPDEPPPGPEVTVEVDHSLMTFTGPPPEHWTIEHVFGLVTGEGASEKSDPARAAAAARKQAMSALESAARSEGANAVGELRLALGTRKTHTSVIAYGTALRIRRDRVS